METDAPDHVSSQTHATVNENEGNTASAASESRINGLRIKQEMNDEEEEDVSMTDAQEEQQQQDSEQGDDAELDANEQEDSDNDASMTMDDDDDYQIAASDYTQANQILFANLVKVLEFLWQKKKNAKTDRKKWNTEKKLQFLFPPVLKKKLNGGDPYPFLRLIMPETDSKRPNLGMQEKTIAKAWSDALGLAKGDAEKLTEFANPDKNGERAGDLSLVVEGIVAERFPQTPSKVTIEQVNNMLDELVDIKQGICPGQRNHMWRDSQTAASISKDEKVSAAKLREQWVSRLLQIPLSPLEHKWIVRILLQKIEIGFGSKSILGYISPYAKDLYNANNSLKRVTQTISDPEWVRRRQERGEREALERQQNKWNKYMPRQDAHIFLGDTISPMLAHRTSFESAMTDIETRHRKFAKELSEEEEDEVSNKFANSLALRFPTFVCEVKLDGQRMLVHVKRGIVTMQTRNGVWFSNLYGPVLAPAVRKALAKYDVDVILDGEVISWDDGRKEVIPFGANRGVANDRRKYLFKHGLVEDRDLNHHQNAQNVVNPNDDEVKEKGTPGNADYIGRSCWLKYIVFDILYVGGPDAEKVISESTTLTGDDLPTGSILKLSGFDRKKILYRLIDPQPNEVELMPSLVVRRNGESEKAANYFSPTSPSMESGLPCSTMDSFECLVRGDIRDWEAKDALARGTKTDEDISNLRVAGMDRFYVEIVENQGLEGLIFKDLLAPYALGKDSKNLRYWNKMKPDYSLDGHSASDIDGVVLGAYYATGMGKAGILNAFLVGCVDEANPGHYMSLCKVNGGSVDRQKLNEILEKTGFNKETDGPAKYGKWFEETSHGKALPDFISERSFQSMNETETGWVCQAKKYPDLWLRPEDSFVVVLNCGEITLSDEFSAGLSLRFPRITKVRFPRDEDGKPVDQGVTRASLFELYGEMELKRSNASHDFDASNSGGSTLGPKRFLTTDANAKRKKAKPKRNAPTQVSSIPIVEKKDSAALAGVTFVVLEGSYSLDEDSLDAEQAKAEGWFEQAAKVQRQGDVQEYISRHRGTCKSTISNDTDVILGGSLKDARIIAYSRALDSDKAAGKKDTELARLRELGGVVKWTYVYSSVRRWINEASQVKAEDIGEGPLSRQQIALGGPPTIPNTQLACPARHEYLLLGKNATIDEQGDVFGIQLWKEELDIFDLKRGLEEVQKSKLHEIEDRREDKKRLKLKGQLSKVNTNDGSVVPWQYAAIESLPARDRWVVAGDIEKLWNFRQPNASSNGAGPIVIFPDLFGEDFGLEESDEVLEEVFSMVPTDRWDTLPEEAQLSSLSSSLPLARTMGAQVTPHLHNGVTHVLCDLKGRDTVFWQADSFDPSFFVNEDHAFQLHRRLLALHGEDDSVVVKFVSQNWIRAQFDGRVVV